MTDELLLEFENLSMGFRNEAGPVEILTQFSFGIGRGQIFALVGESGCGKTVACHAIARLHPEPPAYYRSGRITVMGESVLDMSAQRLRTLRGGTVAYVFQEPSVSLNPVLRVGSQIGETLKLHRPRVPRRSEVERLLTAVGIADAPRLAKAYPCELSGGMQQRVMIAMALGCHPELLVADEPTTALDVTVQAQILALLRQLREETGMSILLVTHDLGVVAETADRVAVMYAGCIVEEADTAALLRRPAHPYTRALLRILPGRGQRGEELDTIAGTVRTTLRVRAARLQRAETRSGGNQSRSHGQLPVLGAGRKLMPAVLSASCTAPPANRPAAARGAAITAGNGDSKGRPPLRGDLEV
jgi:ABC-type dipeptide/oligopeptide/nickel transport system ATPase component